MNVSDHLTILLFKMKEFLRLGMSAEQDANVVLLEQFDDEESYFNYINE